ncbi:MAG: hypothetical protein U0869_02830 [Chloroflexota bacterium]
MTSTTCCSWSWAESIANSAAWFDKAVVDGIVNGVASVTQRSGDRLRTIQTGRVQNYARYRNRPRSSSRSPASSW